MPDFTNSRDPGSADAVIRVRDRTREGLGPEVLHHRRSNCLRQREACGG